MPKPVVLVAALGVFGLSVLMLLLGLNLLPTRVEAIERGVVAPWVVTWSMAWMTILSGVVLGAYLLKTGLTAGRPSPGVVRVR